MDQRKEIVSFIEKNRDEFALISKDIWSHPELSFDESFASGLLINTLEKYGFSIKRNIAGIATAFIAEYGTGEPIIGLLGEYDALPNLSQDNVPYPLTKISGAPGHGCGHNLLGTGTLAAAIALKNWMEVNQIGGTLRYYGCPAEEAGNGKVFMAREGVFEDLSVALTYHPGCINHATKGTNVGSREIKYRFYGISSHAGSSPHMGRSALDAVELMNVGVNYLREHVPEKVRMHYVITKGGVAPNIVPSEAEVWYFLRAAKYNEHLDVINRVRNIARGAALMTETRMEEKVLTGCSNLITNHYLADMYNRAMEYIGPIQYSADEIEYARKINAQYPPENVIRTLSGAKLPLSLKEEAILSNNYWVEDADYIGTGSSDLGDVSQFAPTCMLITACFPSNISDHSWGVVASSGMSIGEKGMLHAAKILSITGSELFLYPEHLRDIRKEFSLATEGTHYISPLPDDMQVADYIRTR